MRIHAAPESNSGAGSIICKSMNRLIVNMVLLNDYNALEGVVSSVTLGETMPAPVQALEFDFGAAKCLRYRQNHVIFVLMTFIIYPVPLQ